MQKYYSRPLTTEQEHKNSGVPYMANVQFPEMNQVSSTGPLSQAISASMLMSSAGAGRTDSQSLINTDQLPTMSDGLPALSSAPTLTEALQATMLSKGLGRMIVIPGSKARRTKRLAEASAPPGRRMNKRLRHMIVLSSIFSVVCMTLLTLSPLDNGQFSVPIVGGVSTWVRAQELDWTIKSHVDEVIHNAPPNQGMNSAAQPAAQLPADLPKSQYVALAQQDAIDAGISPTLFVRQIQQESGFNPNAGSPAGAVGIAQFEPGTAASLGIDPYNPTQALRAAAFLMAGYAKQYNGNYAMALAAYNAGTGNLQNAVNSCGSNWLSCLPSETQNYVRIIMG